MPGRKAKAIWIVLGILLLLGVLAGVFAGDLLSAAGRFPVHRDAPAPSDAVVVLNTGVEYYPRLMEAARLYREGLVEQVVINGDRKTDTLRVLEQQGYQPCCPWYENRLRVLELFEVPRRDVVCIGAEDAYDTVSEAEAVGRVLLARGVTRVIVTTSKSHTRRAHVIWTRMYGDHMEIRTLPAREDPYDPGAWWRSGRQIRWVLAEYGAWVYYAWKMGTGEDRRASAEPSSVTVDWGSL